MPNAMNKTLTQIPSTRSPDRASSTADSEHPQYPRVARRPNDPTTVVHVGKTPVGDGNFVVIAGPCSVESADQIDRIAATVRGHGAAILRGGAFKPRTSPYSFQGLGFEGIEHLRMASQRQAIPVVTEVMSETAIDAMISQVDAFQVGARNMQNYALLRALGQCDKPVLLKRGFGATLREWMLAAEYVAAGGNGRIILCERGIRAFDEATRFTLDLAGALWAKQETHLPVIIDPSHATGMPALIPQLAAAAVAAELDGVMVEVHDDADQALSDADQALDEPQFRALMSRVETIAHALDRIITP